MGQVKNLVLDQRSHPLALAYFEYQCFIDEVVFTDFSEEIDSEAMQTSEKLPEEELPF